MYKGDNLSHSADIGTMWYYAILKEMYLINFSFNII